MSCYLDVYAKTEMFSGNGLQTYACDRPWLPLKSVGAVDAQASWQAGWQDRRACSITCSCFLTVFLSRVLL